MGTLSFSHILLLMMILLLFFGPSKLPELGKSLGLTLRGIKEGMNDFNRESESSQSRKTLHPTQVAANLDPASEADKNSSDSKTKTEV